MKLLILGGTRFLGRHLAQQALAAGHQVTLLHRGHSNPGLFPQARHVIADRNADLSALADPALGGWDAAIDTSAYFPRQVHAVATVLAGRVRQYQLVSTISVYAAFDAPAVGEDTPLQTAADPALEAVGGPAYGGLKVLCEQAAQQAFGVRCLVSRPGLLVGPHDPTGRFTWWVRRFAQAAPGSTVVAPGDPDSPVQFIDARDAAAWMLRQAEPPSHPRADDGDEVARTVNLTGPATPLTVGAWMAGLRDVLQPTVQLHWVPDAALLRAGVAPWLGLPLWLPAADAGVHRVDIGRALRSGLVCRPLADTLHDTWAWAREHDTAPHAGVGISHAQEAALIAGGSGAGG